MNLKENTISGAKWNTISTVFNMLLQIIRISVLARFLEITDFGLMAIVVLVVGFMDMFQDMGISVAIIHKQNISKNQYASLYWFNWLVSIILFFLLITLSPLIGEFFSEKELLQLIPLMAYSLLISALGKQFQTLSHKNMEFKFMAIVSMLSGFSGFLFAVYLAIKGYGVYALAYSILLQYVIYNGIYFVQGMWKYRLKFYFSFIEIIEFVNIGMYQLGAQIINYFTRELDILIIGKLLGSEVLGGYSLAKQLVFRSSVLGSIITTTIIPVFAKLQNDTLKLKKDFLRVFKMVNTLNFSIYSIMIIFASPIVLILYGEKYIHIVLLVQILSVYMYFRSAVSFSSVLIIIMGRTDLGFKWNIISGVLLGGSILIGSFFNITVMTIMMTIMTIFFIFFYWKLVTRKLIDISFESYMNVFIPDFKNMSQLITLIKKK